MDRDERIFLAALGQANQELGRYVVRVLEEVTGAGVTEYTRPLRDVEHTLGLVLLDFGHKLVRRAKAREQVVVESLAPQTETLDRGTGEPTQPGISGSEIQQ